MLLRVFQKEYRSTNLRVDPQLCYQWGSILIRLPAVRFQQRDKLFLLHPPHCTQLTNQPLPLLITSSNQGGPHGFVDLSM